MNSLLRALAVSTALAALPISVHAQDTAQPESAQPPQAATPQAATPQAATPTAWVEAAAAEAEQELIEFRRHIHQHPELGNQEEDTAAYVADHLRKLGFEVHTGIAGTGVVGILKGELDGPTVALRADMDALPVKEATGLPFASTQTGVFHGDEVPVSHACGHDAHTAMLMSAATVMAGHRDKIPGTVVFIFQPAEEGAADVDPFQPDAPSWGARKMVEEGVLERFGVEAIFGVHVMANAHTGQIEYKPGAALNSADGFRVRVEGRQAHGSMPWNGADAVVAGAHIITGMQTIVSRQVNLLQGMGVVTAGSVHAGTAGNIVPGELTMEGTLRSNAPEIRDTILEALPVMVENTAAAHKVTAEVNIAEAMPVTMNDAALTEAMVPALQRASYGKAREIPVNQPASEDFAFFAEKVPGLYVFLGVTPEDQELSEAASNHHPAFMVDETALITGVRSHVEFVLGYAGWKDGQ